MLGLCKLIVDAVRKFQLKFKRLVFNWKGSVSKPGVGICPAKVAKWSTISLH